MNESNSIETIDWTNSTDQIKARLNENSKIENCFNKKIKERKLNSKKLTALSETNGGLSITSFTTVIGAPVGIASGGFTLIFF